MENQELTRLILPLIMCCIFLVMVFLFIRFFFSIKYEKRIKNFCLEEKDVDSPSIFDKLLDFLSVIVRFISKLLKKSHIINNYANKLEKYLMYNENKNFKPLDYISMKFLFMFFIQLLYIVTIIINSSSFNIFTFILFSIISFMIIDILIIVNYKRKKSFIEEQLLQAIVIMNNAFKSGKNILQAIKIVKDELPSPIKEEFNTIYLDLSYGLELQLIFERFYNRVRIDEIKYITSSLALLSKTGGNIVTVFNMIEKNFYDRLKVKNELFALTSSSKFLYRILTILPFVFVLVIVVINPTYFTPLINTTMGLLLDIVMLLLYGFYILIIRKMMKVDEV